MPWSGDLLALSLAVAAAVMVFGWAASLPLKDVSIVDVLWGLAGAAIAAVAFVNGDGPLFRRALAAGLAAFWGLRLAAHIALRKRGKGEDFRYAAMRASHGRRFPLRSLATVFLLQAALIWIVSLPVQVAAAALSPPRPTVFDVVGGLIALLGVAIESVADAQLRAFRIRGEGRGGVLQTGLWRYSRHPNYFGESLIWWGLWVTACATPRGWLTVVSPLLMTWLLVKVSGIPLLERALAERRAGYREYMRRTSRFVPLPPGWLRGSRTPGGRKEG